MANPGKASRQGTAGFRRPHEQQPATAARLGNRRLNLSKWPRFALLFFLDGILALFSLWAAYRLRFEDALPVRYSAALLDQMSVLILSRVAAGVVAGIHRWAFRLSGLRDAMRLLQASMLGSLGFLASISLGHLPMPPRSVVVMEFLLWLTFAGTLRFGVRIAGLFATQWQPAIKKKKTTRALIIGAGATGESLLRDLQRSPDHDYTVVGFLDDDSGKQGLVVGGKPVLGTLDDLPAAVTKTRAQAVLLAIPRLPAAKLRRLLLQCAQLKVRFRLLPVSFAYLENNSSRSLLQCLSPEDLLPRPEEHFSSSPENPWLAERRVLVTGAAGSIGSELVRQLVRAGAGQVMLLDINENGLYLLARELDINGEGPRLVCQVADIRDPDRIRQIFESFRPHDVFHAAAHKHVPLMEQAPWEAVKNNILGTLHVAEAAKAHAAERMVFISTDKAVRPTSIMGATKRVGELLMRHLGATSRTRFVAVRFGNVLGSQGSVVPLFQQQLQAGGPLTVTHPEVRRYFMTIGEAVGLVLKAAYSNYGDLLVLDMGEQIRILDLARMMITMAGLVPDEDVSIVFTGLRPGEKLFEELLTEEEERTVRVHQKILVAEGPPPPPTLLEDIQELAEAARHADAEQIYRIMVRLVPSFQPYVQPLSVPGAPSTHHPSRILER